MRALEHHLGKAGGGGVVHFVWVWTFICNGMAENLNKFKFEFYKYVD